MISGSSVLLDLPRSQRNGAPRRLRCRRACGSTRGLCSSAGVRTPDSGHTDSLVRLDNNRSPLSRWDDLFYFAERVSNKISSSGQRRGRRRSAVNHFRFKALGRTQPPGPKPLVGHLRTPILGVFLPTKNRRSVFKLGHCASQVSLRCCLALRTLRFHFRMSSNEPAVRIRTIGDTGIARGTAN